MVTYDFSNGTVKLYLNGSLVHTASTITGSIYSASNSDTYFRVARNSTNSNGYINGAISQIRVYSDVLTDAEVLNDYNATKNLFQTNNNGTISATVDANVDAGFSIVKYTGSGAAGMTVGHGLTNDIPEIIIIKNLDNTTNWQVFGGSLFTRMQLDQAGGDDANFGLTITSTTFQTTQTVGQEGNSAWNATDDYIAYCFHSVAGYSKIGSYTGVSTGVRTHNIGFKPSFVIIKSSNAGQSWCMYDNKRRENNSRILFADLPDAEYTINNSALYVTFVSNGFTTPGQLSAVDGSGRDFIYMAFK
jgi:hypothetical protein